ncbi:pilus assembly FimT family protein [Thalassoroseus pseudoceratinae]|uniref:pilus assembly FimT family protein n=1 Tax=Thalassoroseus pseudoceratinae TaxID=2713176 RepID=UPI00141DC660|nr:GspH/FimT family pseudopilin [Thalassoroseus pseudoceratinae]
MHRAYTLVELVIVMLVMGILAATAMPQYFAMLNHYRVEAAAAQLAADLRWARRSAQQTGTSQSVNFTLPSQYAMPGMSDPDHPSQGFVVDFTLSQPGVSIQAVDFDSSTTMSFDIYGRPQTSTPLTADGTIQVGAGSQIRTVTVNAVTGQVSGS